MRFIKSLISASLLASLVFGFSACDKRENFVNYPPGITDNVVQAAEKEGLNVFAAAFRRAGMEEAFRYLGNYTIFAPTDAAFAAAGITGANVNTIAPETLRLVLRNHILPGRTTKLSFLPGPNAAYNNINRDFIYTSFYENGAFAGTYFNGAKVLKTDITSLNGVIHTVDALLAPPMGNLTQTLAANPNLTFFEAAINRAGLAATLNGSTTAITVLAPTNAAFQAAGYADIAAINAATPATLANIVRMHIIPQTAATTSGGRLFTPDFRTGSYATQNTNLTVTAAPGNIVFRGPGNTSDAKITMGNMLFRTNISTGAPSVLHVIDRVLLP